MTTTNIPIYTWTSLGIIVLVGVIAGLAKACETTSPSTIPKKLIQSAKEHLGTGDVSASRAYMHAANMLGRTDANLERKINGFYEPPTKNTPPSTLKPFTI
jgi:hypothetical protein